MRSADIVLVNPGGHERIYQALSSNLTAVEPPVWAGLMATFLRNRGFSVKILDANANHMSHEETADEIIRLNPVLTAMVIYGHQPSASTQTMPGARAISKVMKQKASDMKIIMVGGHVSALPERTLREEPIDFTATGEGIHTLAKLIDVLKSGSSNDLAEVPGLLYWENGEIKKGELDKLMQNLDKEIPGLAWDLLDMKKYRAHNWHCFGFTDEREPYASLYTTLGCTFKCTFCCINSPFGGPSYRMRSPANVVEEIELLVQKYGVKNIKIADEMFVLNVKHVSDICDMLIERNLDLNIWAYARVDTVKREGLLEKMKKAGFNWLALGIESGSANIRDGVSKSFGQDQIYQSVQRIRDVGINVCANYIFGLPDDDWNSMQATLDLSLDLNAEYANFYSCMAYPGSPLYEDALKQGLELPKSWSGYSQHSEDALPLPTKHLSGKEVLSFRDKAFDVYFNNPKYLVMMEKKFGSESVDHVKQMTAIRLVRRSAS
ncbi:MAG: B12-binding domain-containing radical SAM protein [Thaumarchaeota archaeon]|nr:B12-binding domain-containing radical SAM protein [Nitrososphaerota archaeon]